MTPLAVCCFIILSGSVAVVYGQASAEEYPNNWNVIADTYNYRSLLSDSFWKTSDLDGDGEGYVEQGGNFKPILEVCPQNFVLSGDENNWVFTHHIRYDAANEVFYNISFNYVKCQFIPNCHPHATVYRYDTNIPDSSSRTNTSKYELLTGDEMTSRFGFASSNSELQVRDIVRPPQFDGFYLGIRDTGTCGAVLLRMIIYYVVCPARVNGLVNFPEVAVPRKSAPNDEYSASCAPNSHAVTSLVVDINSTTSECTERADGEAKCQCDGGYYQFNETACEGESKTALK